MLTPEREAEIRKFVEEHGLGGNYMRELLAEIDRLREESDAMEESLRAEIAIRERAIRDALEVNYSQQVGDILRAGLGEGE